MKLQGLAVIAIIIILPMTIILTAYSQNQIKTLQLQTQYDSKLKNATYDAIKTFQLNMSNSDTSDLANSKLRDINASINTFYNSLSSNFNMSGYGKDVLQNYVPAVVYTLYDGYYIHSAYVNTLDGNDVPELVKNNSKYENGKLMYGLKPYVYYSCRYKPNANSDFVITYSLDSYITIQGMIDGKPVNVSGYLLTGVTRDGTDANWIYKYRGIQILSENNKEGLKQNIYMQGDTSKAGTNDEIKIVNTYDNDTEQTSGSIVNYPCKKINGVKYYDSNSEVFTSINGVKHKQDGDINVTENNNAIEYYESAYNFKEFINGNSTLNDLKVGDAVDPNGNKYTNSGIYKDQDIDNPFVGHQNDRIFGELFNGNGTFIEDENSNFNVHRMQVIKNSIETNLASAIANYNEISTSSVNFQMPKLNDEEWERLSKNISMITFLQGLNIGSKIYNGYSIISNNTNEDFVSDDSIYILANDKYHRVDEKDLKDNLDGNSIGILSSDFARRSAEAFIEQDGVDDGAGGTKTEKIYKTIYYYPREEEASYTSIINPNSSTSHDSIAEYVKGLIKNTPSESSNEYKLAQLYYTALGRERFGMYRVQNKFEEIQEYLTKNRIDWNKTN